MRVLVTGGAGFIGGHLADELLFRGEEVKIIDNLEQPTHLEGKPDYIPQEAEFIQGDMRNTSDLEKALEGVDCVYHQAATGGFTPRIREYLDSNSIGTANLLEVILRKKLPIQKIVVASSIAVYGEGAYQCKNHGKVYPAQRSMETLLKHKWEQRCSDCNEEVMPLPTREDKPIDPQSMYALTKYDEERMSILIGKQNSIPVTALRYFVTFGPRQSITNPYTGLCSIFSQRILNNKPLIIYEDGMQSRDFIFVKDVVAANILAMNNPKTDYNTLNIGRGEPIRVLDIAKMLMKMYGQEVPIEMTGLFRPADVRHMIADNTKAKELIGFNPKYSFEQGIKEYVDWIATRSSIKDYFSEAQRKLKESGVVKG